MAQKPNLDTGSMTWPSSVSNDDQASRFTSATHSIPEIDFAKYLSYNDNLEDPIIFLPRRGNFSDFNVLINATTYALLNRRRIVLSNVYLARFSGSTWCDYFVRTLPFAEEVKLKVPRESSWPKGGNAFTVMKEFISPLVARDVNIEIPELGYSGSIFYLMRSLGRNIVKVCPQIDQSASDIISDKIEDRENYSAIHVRQGDKLHNRPAPPVDIYLRTLHSIMPRSDSIFVLTDDVRSLINIKNSAPTMNIFSLTTEEQLGFYSNEHVSLDYQTKQEELRKLLIEVTIAQRARCFIGWYQSNVSNFIALTSDHVDSCRDAFRPTRSWYNLG